MLRHCNQQLDARENRIPRSSPIETYTVAQFSTERFGFSIFSPCSVFPYAATPHSPYDPSRSLAHPRSQKLLRPQRNGHSVVPSGQVHARKKIRKKSSLLVSIQSLHSIHATILFFFFPISPSFRILSRFTVCAITFTCVSTEKCHLTPFQKSFTRHLNPGKLILTDCLSLSRSLKNRVAIKYKRYTSCFNGNVTNVSRELAANSNEKVIASKIHPSSNLSAFIPVFLSH